MQHWQVYLKWNEHFFEEQYTAFLQGRSTGKDPSKGWYSGELWFFDNYVVSFALIVIDIACLAPSPHLLLSPPLLQIPLAKKLKDCGVFGVSSDEVSTTRMFCLVVMSMHLKRSFILGPTVLVLRSNESGGMGEERGRGCCSLRAQVWRGVPVF